MRKLLCSNCKYCNDEGMFDVCIHDSAFMGIGDYESSKFFYTCDAQRDSGNEKDCGIDGRYYEDV